MPDFRRIEVDAQRIQQAMPARAPDFSRVRRAADRKLEKQEVVEISQMAESREFFRRIFFSSIVTILFVMGTTGLLVYAKTERAGSEFVQAIDQEVALGTRPSTADVADKATTPGTVPISKSDRDPPPADVVRQDENRNEAGGAQSRDNPSKAPTTTNVEKPTLASRSLSASGGKPRETATEPSRRQGESTDGSTFFVQLASYRDRDGARTGWRDLKAKFALLDHHGPVVVTGEVDEARVHRLRAGPFHGLAEADALCQEVRRRQGDCFVVQG